MYDSDNTGICCEQSDAVFAEDGGVNIRKRGISHLEKFALQRRQGGHVKAIAYSFGIL